jgi:hypothetical protein
VFPGLPSPLSLGSPCEVTLDIVCVVRTVR